MVEVEVKATSSLILGEVKVLLVNVSISARVESVPVVGNVTEVVPVVVSVSEYAPEVVKASAKEIVLELGIVKVPVEVVIVRPLMEVAKATPNVGVVSVGELEKTTYPAVPCSSLMMEAKLAEVISVIPA